MSPGAGPVTTELEFDARRAIFLLFLVLVGCEILFVFGDWIFNVENLLGLSPVRSFWNIAREGGVASWFAITQTWMLGLTAAFMYGVVRAGDVMRWRRVGWAIIALFLLYMAMDDGARFHERVGGSVRIVFQDPAVESGNRQIGFFPSYTWQLVFLPMFAAFGLFILWFLNKELKSARDKLMVVAAIGLFVLAVTADFFEGLQAEHPLNLHSWISTTWQLEFEGVVHYSKSLEEFMEMLGMTFLWVTFLRHLVTIAPEIKLRFRNLPT
jgi:hypothetical protein